MIAAFGSFEIDLDRVEIRRDGVIVAVQPQVFDVIQYLLEHRDRVVPKEELLDEVWGDRFVSESALTSRIKSARRALGDDGSAQRVIKTVHGRGYRFVATLDDPGTESASERPSAPAPSAAPATPAAPEPSDSTPARTWPMVGRHHDLHRLMQAIDRSRGGVIIGAEGVGRSTLLDAVAYECVARGIAVVRVKGAAGSRTIPLSGVAHLLPPDVLDTATAGRAIPDDLARSALWQAARAALVARLSDAPTVLVVDDVDRLDDVSHSIVESLAIDSAIVTVASVGARSSSGDRFGDLARQGSFELVELGPLDDADVDSLLFRRLGGAVELGSLELLVETSEGLPGRLVDLVETSITAGVLVRDENVWRLTGEPVTARSIQWPPPGLSPDAIAAAGRLALLGSVPLVIAQDLIGDDELDELDRARLIALAGTGEHGWIRIADPLLSATIAADVPVLRRRRWVDEMTEALAQRAKPPSLMATVLDWHPGADVVDPEELVGGATAALHAGDLTTAERLIRDLDSRSHPEIDVIEAEVAAGLGQFDRAARAIERVDIDRLGELAALMALRQRATLDFVHAGRHDAALSDLRAEAARRDGEAATSLAARLANLLIAAHRYDEVDSIAERMGEVDGPAGLELAIAAAWAGAGRGEFDRSIGVSQDVLGQLGDVPAIHASEIRDSALVLSASSLQQSGRLGDAARLVRSAASPGRVSRLGFFPAVAADIELSAGRPRSAREILRSATTAWVRTRYPQFTGLITIMAARCELALGNVDAARDLATEARGAITAGTGAARARNVTWLVEVAHRLGLEPIDPTEALASVSERGTALAELELRCAIVTAAATPEEARRHLERVASVAAGFDGSLWPIRVAEVRARAEGRPLDAVVAAYRDLGYERLAANAERAG